MKKKTTKNTVENFEKLNKRRCMEKRRHRDNYYIDFSPEQWEELIAMSFEPFEFEQHEELTQGQWLALAEMALGKAHRIWMGAYDFPGEDNADFRGEWEDQLREIAAIILEKFEPGNG